MRQMISEHTLKDLHKGWDSRGIPPWKCRELWTLACLHDALDNSHPTFWKGEAILRLRAGEVHWNTFGHACIFVFILIIIMLIGKFKKKKVKKIISKSFSAGIYSNIIFINDELCYTYRSFVPYFNWCIIYVEWNVKCTFRWIGKCISTLSLKPYSKIRTFALL